MNAEITSRSFTSTVDGPRTLRSLSRAVPALSASRCETARASDAPGRRRYMSRHECWPQRSVEL